MHTPRNINHTTKEKILTWQYAFIERAASLSFEPQTLHAILWGNLFNLKYKVNTQISNDKFAHSEIPNTFNNT